MIQDDAQSPTQAHFTDVVMTLYMFIIIIIIIITKKRSIETVATKRRGTCRSPKYVNTIPQKGKYRDTVRENRQYRNAEKSSLQIYLTVVTPVQQGPVFDTTTHM